MCRVFFLISFLVLSILIYPQNKTIVTNDIKKIMTDSLFESMVIFCKEVINDFTKEKVSEKNISLFLNYLNNHLTQNAQSMSYLSPYKVKKDTVIKYLKDELMPLIGSTVAFQYIGWDGWDGKTPYVGFRFDLKHKNYDKQFLVITDTKNKIHCIFCLNSR